MLQTDLNGVINEIKTNSTWHFIILIIVFIIGFLLINKYFYNDSSRNNFGNIVIGRVYGSGTCNSDVPGIDKLLIENEINLPNRNPKYLTSSMVIPEIPINDEKRKQTKMEILNMFYDSTDDLNISISNRPKGLYLIP